MKGSFTAQAPQSGIILGPIFHSNCTLKVRSQTEKVVVVYKMKFSLKNYTGDSMLLFLGNQGQYDYQPVLFNPHSYRSKCFVRLVEL